MSLTADPPVPGGRRRLPRWAGRFLLVCAGALVGLASAEVAARLIAPAPAAELLGEPSRDATPGLYQTHPTLGHVPVPGYDHAWPTAGGWIRTRIGPEGYRLPAPDPTRPRWLAVGDSYTIAVQVDEEETFAARLGQATDTSVINGGVDGYSTWQAGMRYEQLDPIVDAQGVIYVLFEGNDLTDNQVFLFRMRAGVGPDGRLAAPAPDPRFQAEPLSPWRPPSLTDHLRARSLLFAAARVVLHRPEVAQGGTLDRYRRETLAMTHEGRGERSRLLGELASALRALGGAAAARGDRVLVALAPSPWMLDPDQAETTLQALGQRPGGADIDAFRADIARVVRGEGLQACDLMPPLRAAEQAGQRPYLRYDGHWSARGHEVVAQALARCISGSG